MKFIFSIIVLFGVINFTSESAAGPSLSDLCARMEATMEAGEPKPNDDNRDFEGDNGYVALYTVHRDPDFISGIRKLVTSYEKPNPAWKYSAALGAHPVICLYGNSTDLGNLVKGYDIPIKPKHMAGRWVGATDLRNLINTIAYFRRTAHETPRSAYFLGLSYMLGRGVECDISQAIAWFKISSKEIENSNQLISIIKKIQTKTQKACLRSLVIEDILTR